MNASFSASADEASGEAGLGYSESETNGVTNTVANIKAGGGLTILLTSGVMEGTDSAGDTAVNAKTVELLEAVDTHTETTTSVDAEVSFCRRGINGRCSGL